MSEPLTGTPAHLYTIAEAAAALSMSEIWLRRQVAAHKVRHVRMGRSVRFTDAQLADIITARTQEPVVPRSGRRKL